MRVKVVSALLYVVILTALFVPLAFPATDASAGSSATGMSIISIRVPPRIRVEINSLHKLVMLTPNLPSGRTTYSHFGSGVDGALNVHNNRNDLLPYTIRSFDMNKADRTVKIWQIDGDAFEETAAQLVASRKIISSQFRGTLTFLVEPI